MEKDRNGILFLEPDDVFCAGLLPLILNTLQQGTSDALSSLRREYERNAEITNKKTRRIKHGEPRTTK